MTACRYEVINDEIVLVWCKTHPHLIRAANSERHESDSEQRLSPPSDADLPHTPSTQIHPKGLRVDAYVDTQTRHIHIPGGDAQFTIPAWDAITRVLGAMNGLLYDTNLLAGHHTRPVDGLVSSEDALNKMLKGSGLQWIQVDDAVLISADTAPPMAH